MVIMPASSAAALIHFSNAANAHASVVAHSHGLLICHIEIATGVNTSTGSVVIHTTLKVLRGALSAIGGAAPDISNTINIADKGQRKITVLINIRVIGGATIDSVSRAFIDDDWMRNWQVGATTARWVCVAARVHLGERWEGVWRQISVLLGNEVAVAWSWLDNWKAHANHSWRLGHSCTQGGIGG
jgi:hypothetical protein